MSKRRKKTFLGACFLLFLPIFLQLKAQNTTSTPQKGEKITCTADRLTYDAFVNADLQILTGNVVFEHEGAVCYADTAFFNEVQNTIDAYGKNLIIYINDSLTLKGQHVHYDGNTKIAHIDGEVILTDTSAVLYTQKLMYDRNNNIAYYNTGGRIEDADNVLISKESWFYTQQNQIYFKDSVVLTNPQYTVYSDTLRYNTQTEVAYFLGPTRIISSDSGTIYCEYGWYDTHSEVCEFQQNAEIINQSQHIKGETIWYDKTNDMGIAKQNVEIYDTKEEVLFWGNYAEYRSLQKYAYITDSAVAVMINKSDSLFLHADMLHVTFDSNKEVETMNAYYSVKFYRKDLQGSCDSLIYLAKDSIITMFDAPVLWSQENQMLADTVRMYIIDGQIKEIHLIENASIFADVLAQKKFNQLKGETIIAYFADSVINLVFVDGSAECLYYVQEENKDLIGVQKGTSSQMRVFFQDGEIEKIRFYTHVKGNIYPEKDLKDPFLKNFIWLDEYRPKEKEDIFTTIIYKIEKQTQIIEIEESEE
ncbi:MAG: hypothetical protein LBR36_05530 [Bacteroidales bacterium]|jgi:lipopolysaccharide export system protein LptA|nr:hypothetical protein [Bacteroidales bacterium]